MLHVSKSGTTALQLTWSNAISAPAATAVETGYLIYRYQHEAYHPLGMMPAGSARDGWFTFTDRYASPFEEYGYAVRPYAKLLNDQYVYGPYSRSINGYTVTDDENRPRVSVTETENEMGRVYTAEVTPATGGVDSPFIQWQVYEREQGGWIDVENGHGLTNLSVTGSENLAKEYRCRVSQRVGDRIYIVYSDVQLSGYIFVADKSREYQKDGKTLVDYVLVHEDGSLEVIASSNTRYNTKYVYSYDNGDILRVAFVQGMQSWSEPSSDDDGGDANASTPTGTVLLSAGEDGNWTVNIGGRSYTFSDFSHGEGEGHTLTLTLPQGSVTVTITGSAQLGGIFYDPESGDPIYGSWDVTRYTFTLGEKPVLVSIY